MRWTLLAAAAIALAGGAWWMLARPDGARDDARRAGRALPVRLARVEVDSVARRFETSGTVAARERVVVTTEEPGLVEAIFVADGARVAAGERIARLDDSAEQSRLEAAQTQLAEARRDYERATVLEAEGVLAESVVDMRRAALADARARVAEARRALEDRTVRAPYDGVVGRVEASLGSYVDPGDAIVELTTVDEKRVRFALPVEIASRVAVGDPVRVRTGPERDAAVRGGAEGATPAGGDGAAPPDGPDGPDTPDGPEGKAPSADGRPELPARIRLVEEMASVRDRLVEVEASLDEASGDATRDLVPGRFVAVAVEVDRHPAALLVPQSAITWSGPQAFVFRVDAERRARRTPVALGPRRGADVVVRSEALGAGDVVVSHGLQKVRDGARVEALDAGSAGGAAPDAADAPTGGPAP